MLHDNFWDIFSLKKRECVIPNNFQASFMKKCWKCTFTGQFSTYLYRFFLDLLLVISVNYYPHKLIIFCLPGYKTFQVLLKDTLLGSILCRGTLRLKSIGPFADYSYKFVIFDWSKMGVKVIENSLFLQSTLKYVRYHSSKDLEPNFLALLKIRVFKVRSFQFYLIRCPFFANFNFEGLYS